MVRAAVLPAVGAPLEIAEIDLPDPGPGQVRIRLEIGRASCRERV